MVPTWTTQFSLIALAFSGYFHVIIVGTVTT